MPRRTISFVSAIFVILLAAGTSSAQTSLAAEGCATRPGSTAPQGQHWYYRLDRTVHRACWYLGPEGAKVAQSGRPSIRAPLQLPHARLTSLASAEPSAEALNAYASRVQIPTDRNGLTDGDRQAAANFAARWPDRSGTLGTTAAEFASTHDDDAGLPGRPNTQDGLSSTGSVPASADRAVAEMSGQEPIDLERMLALLAAALAVSVLIIRSAVPRQAARAASRSASPDQRRSSAYASGPFERTMSVVRLAAAARSMGATGRSVVPLRRNGVANSLVGRDASGQGGGAMVHQASGNR
jgi:hypothetical protein